MSEFAMLMSRRCVVLRLSVLADRVMVLCLMMVRGSSVMVGSRLVVMLTSGMFWVIVPFGRLPEK